MVSTSNTTSITPSFTSLMNPDCYRWLIDRTGPLISWQEIAGGHHQMWLCRSQRGRFVLRRPIDQALYGTDYRREQRVLEAIRPYSWAIDGDFYALDEPWLLYPYIRGQHSYPRQFTQEPSLWQQLCQLLEILPEILDPVEFPDGIRAMDIYLKHYLSLATHAPVAAHDQAAQWISSSEFAHNDCLSLNHHDITPANLLISEENRLVLLDWEYAAISLQGWDIGTLGANFSFTSAQRQTLQRLSGLSSGQLIDIERASTLLNLCWNSQYEINRMVTKQWRKWLNYSRKSRDSNEAGGEARG